MYRNFYFLNSLFKYRRSGSGFYSQCQEGASGEDPPAEQSDSLSRRGRRWSANSLNASTPAAYAAPTSRSVPSLNISTDVAVWRRHFNKCFNFVMVLLGADGSFRQFFDLLHANRLQA